MMSPAARTFGVSAPAKSTLLWVMLGGFLGSMARFGVFEVLAAWAEHGAVVATVMVNLGGAFGLGFLVYLLGTTRPESPRASRIRALCGTGFFGGLTTYSGFAVDIVMLSGGVPTVLYVLFSLVGGVVAASCGALMGSRLCCSGRS